MDPGKQPLTRLLLHLAQPLRDFLTLRIAACSMGDCEEQDPTWCGWAKLRGERELGSSAGRPTGWLRLILGLIVNQSPYFMTLELAGCFSLFGSYNQHFQVYNDVNSMVIV